MQFTTTLTLLILPCILAVQDVSKSGSTRTPHPGASPRSAEDVRTGMVVDKNPIPTPNAEEELCSEQGCDSFASFLDGGQSDHVDSPVLKRVEQADTLKRAESDHWRSLESADGTAKGKSRLDAWNDAIEAAKSNLKNPGKHLYEAYRRLRKKPGKKPTTDLQDPQNDDADALDDDDAAAKKVKQMLGDIRKVQELLGEHEFIVMDTKPPLSEWTQKENKKKIDAVLDWVLVKRSWDDLKKDPYLFSLTDDGIIPVYMYESSYIPTRIYVFDNLDSRPTHETRAVDGVVRDAVDGEDRKYVVVQVTRLGSV